MTNATITTNGTYCDAEDVDEKLVNLENVLDTIMYGELSDGHVRVIFLLGQSNAAIENRPKLTKTKTTAGHCACTSTTAKIRYPLMCVPCQPVPRVPAEHGRRFQAAKARVSYLR